ncbi:MAG TPA: hypothetical protein PK971_00550 [Saprospiraceae bacterium]|nr:hypothetical protein [Saprospiraceae bacterium]HND86780.1 hypothetical protein [Saprospiraceae bacterium]HNG88631.1 hypothetical protein [Saprospiraceae bacterium]
MATCLLRLLLLLSLCSTPALLPAQNLVQKWYFRHKVKPLSAAIQEGRPIRMSWKERGEERSERGTISAIDADSLTFLPSGADEALRIAKQDVSQITHRVKGRARDSWGGFFIFIGATALLILFLLFAFFRPYCPNVLDGSHYGPPSKTANGLYITGFLVAVLSLGIGLSSRKLRIEQPFSSEWSIESAKVEIYTPVPVP